MLFPANRIHSRQPVASRGTQRGVNICEVESEIVRTWRREEDLDDRLISIGSDTGRMGQRLTLIADPGARWCNQDHESVGWVGSEPCWFCGNPGRPGLCPDIMTTPQSEHEDEVTQISTLGDYDMPERIEIFPNSVPWPIVHIPSNYEHGSGIIDL